MALQCGHIKQIGWAGQSVRMGKKKNAYSFEEKT
jgi:hypothetical protein